MAFFTYLHNERRSLKFPNSLRKISTLASKLIHTGSQHYQNTVHNEYIIILSMMMFSFDFIDFNIFSVENI